MHGGGRYSGQCFVSVLHERVFVGGWGEGGGGGEERRILLVTRRSGGCANGCSVCWCSREFALQY